MVLLTQDEIANGMPAGWEGSMQGLRRTYTYADFAEALAAVNRIGEVAEAMQHHPDIDIRWNQVALSVVSHEAGGVTDTDLELARRISAAA